MIMTYQLNYCYRTIMEIEVGAFILTVEAGPSGFTGLHGASYLRVADLVAGVLEMKERMLRKLIT